MTVVRSSGLGFFESLLQFVECVGLDGVRAKAARIGDKVDRETVAVQLARSLRAEAIARAEALLAERAAQAPMLAKP